MWFIKTFDELSTQELFDIIEARTEVFVIEQNRVYRELDKIDLKSIHIFKYDQGQIVAYARIYTIDHGISFGRILTASNVRGTGIGKELMQQVLETCRKSYPHQTIHIEAQDHALSFYEQFGFKVTGPKFEFNHTPHYPMELKTTQSLD
ncbi:GNAT family N-acetyltransferase [Pediococcus argentinicus]|uniref:N-acetyltransferase domain-containing protein n=2 Tax=Pediococcus argentinicus TaxID=480391 RepID=A0A0R2NAP8_9LACO|nr:GNAT family N-acetyltransferase [Pediococcus argentinicus]KRO20877.1 hypothetical protein IV88_GL001479 [Pediococcus argentinicus]NKZ23166.1 GNAT family N-acetyltransferase [Pediococcus argentinicus]GEP20348.1 GNAT family acetyltransferase [Pediococcus argentinicus]